jgi:biopolymer transport protein ExbB
MLTDLFKNFTALGAEWVLWLLVLLSIFSIGVMIERALFFASRKVDLDALKKAVAQALADDDISKVEKGFGESEAMACQVALAGLRERNRGIDVVSEAMSGAKARARKEHERLLVVLGTLGNNAPFIGLFGTVLGIINAFDKLQSHDSAGGGQVKVIQGDISEALVATAVGLLVAIPAVVAFNYFNRRTRAEVNATDEVAHVVLGELHADDHAEESA